MAFRSSSNTAYGTATNLVVTAPASITNGDILLLWWIGGVSGTPPTPTPPSGFAAATGLTLPISVTAAGFRVDRWLWYKVASSESGNYTVTHASCSAEGAMVVYSGRDTTTPFDVNCVSATSSGSNGTTTSYTSITPVTNACDIIFISHDWGNTPNKTAPTGTTPTITERLDTTMCWEGDGNLATAGATGAKTQTNNNVSASDGWGSVTAALRPLSGATALPPFRKRPDWAAIRRSAFW